MLLVIMVVGGNFRKELHWKFRKLSEIIVSQGKTLRSHGYELPNSETIQQVVLKFCTGTALNEAADAIQPELFE